jgi:hypothetical protein
MNIINIVKIIREVKIIIKHLKKNEEVKNLLLSNQLGFINLDDNPNLAQ